MATETRLNDFVTRLRDVLTSKLGDHYGEVSNLGDLLVDGHGVLLGEFAEDLADLRTRQSLALLRNLPSSPERDAAVDGLLSNLFIKRDLGRFSRGYATMTFSQRVDTVLPRQTRFFRTAGLVFYPNLAQDLLIPAASFRPTYDPRGTVVGWSYDVPLIAARTGSQYDIDPGQFNFVDPFSAYLQTTANTNKFQGGASADTSDQLLNRAETSLGLRTLGNSRSNDAALRNAFSDISRVLTLGHGDIEMQRDVQSLLGASTAVHLGGCQDIYVTLPSQVVSVTSIIGGSVARADGQVLGFQDSAATFLMDNVVAGDVLNVLAGPAGAPAQYVVRSVEETALEIRAEVPFAEATDERTPPFPDIEYSIGNNYPTYDNKVAAATSSTARTSKELAIPRCAILPGQPIYEILRIEILDPPAELAPYVSPDTGTVVFSARRNSTWSRAPLPGEELSYWLRIENPKEAQSARMIAALELGWPDLPLDGVSVEITYRTPVGFSSVNAFAQDPEQRPRGTDLLIRAEHPIHISGTIKYRVRKSIDEVAAQNNVIAFVEAALPGDLDLNAMRNAFTRSSEDIRAVLESTFSYELTLPDGRVARYETEDRIEVLPSSNSSARLINALELGLPVVNTTSALRTLLQAQGVSDRVVRYFTDTDRLTVEQVP